MRLTRTLAVVTLAVSLLATACGGSDGNGGDSRATRETKLAHASAASGPGKKAREVCEPMIRQAVEYEVGTPLEGKPAEAVDGDTFTCTYRVAGGAIVMSVQDLKRRPAARANFEGLRTAAGSDVERLPGLGEGAFLRPDDSLVVRKDAMVLTIDMTGFAAPVDGRDKSAIATNLGVAVMGCW
jgi:hypothetical protein